jgi:uncharacterized phage protein (TIGR01671 family)
MREIRFRAWDLKNKQWSDYDNIYIDQDGDIWEIEERSQYMQQYMHKERLNGKVEIVWCTGLKDRNGTPVYEGDIVYGYEGGEFGSILSSWHGVVYWNEGKACFYVKDGQENLPIMHYYFDEVVGNMYEHAEKFKRLLADV